MHEDAGMVTFRSSGHDGPVAFGYPVTAISEAPAGQARVRLANTWTSSLFVDQLEIRRYVP